MKILAIAEYLDLVETRTLIGMHEAGIDLSVMLHPSVPFFDTLQQELPDVSPLEMRQAVDPAAIRCIRDKLLSKHYDVLCMMPTKRPVIYGLRASHGMSIKRVAYRGVVGRISRLNILSHLSYLNPRLDKIICACDAVRFGLRSLGIPDRKLVRIYKGHGAGWSRPAPRAALVPHGIRHGDFVIACATHMRPRKGIPVLLDALERMVRETDIPAHVLLIGQVSDRRVRRKGRGRRISHRVHFAGDHPDATALLGACDAFVMPSLRREGLSRSVIEAMAQGVPTIVSDTGGLPELIRHGESGLVVRAGDAVSLADAIIRLARNPDQRRELGANARARIETDFTIEDTLRDTIAAFRKLAPSGGPLPDLEPIPVRA